MTDQTALPALSEADDPGKLQRRVAYMVLATCEAGDDPTDPIERADRFLEEALELYQALGHDAARARRILSYVYSRPVGEVHQEVGGAQVTLMALCDRIGEDALAAGHAENERCRDPAVREKIRAKRALRVPGDPLPGGRMLPEEESREESLLTNREKDVLRLIATGHSNKGAARALGLSVRTVETHRLNLRRRTGMGHDKVALVALARSLNLLDF